jgi:hypothetical protein
LSAYVETAGGKSDTHSDVSITVFSIMSNNLLREHVPRALAYTGRFVGNAKVLICVTVSSSSARPDAIGKVQGEAHLRLA